MAGGRITFQCPAAEAAVLHLRATDGREVACLDVTPRQPLTLPAHLPAGLYLLTLTARADDRPLRQARLLITGE